MTDKYGKIHTDGSRSGGQPLVDSIEAKALALVKAVLRETESTNEPYPISRDYMSALCRAIEQHEAFKQEVSDVMLFIATTYPMPAVDFSRFIIPKPKPDPIAEAWIEATGNTVGMEPLNAALEARGLGIREKGQ